jgi:hypothetical protein
MRPMWRNIAAFARPDRRRAGRRELWYDDRDIPFLQEDVKDEAEIQQTQAVTIHELINAGLSRFGRSRRSPNGDNLLQAHRPGVGPAASPGRSAARYRTATGSRSCPPLLPKEGSHERSDSPRGRTSSVP